MEYTIEIFKEVNVVSYYQTERTVQGENTHKSIKASVMTVTIAEDMALQSEQPEICEKYWIVRTRFVYARVGASLLFYTSRLILQGLMLIVYVFRSNTSDILIERRQDNNCCFFKIISVIVTTFRAWQLEYFLVEP